VAESQCALLGKSNEVSIAIERAVWLTGRERQQKACRRDHPSQEEAIFFAGKAQSPFRLEVREAGFGLERPRAPAFGTRGH
jgi:hypothetical protein